MATTVVALLPTSAGWERATVTTMTTVLGSVNIMIYGRVYLGNIL